MSKKLDLTAIFALVFYPLVLILLVTKYISDYQAGLFEIGLAVAGYYVSNITVGIGLHRLWSHSSYKTNAFVEFVLTLLAAGTLQGPVLSWASNHFKHHTYTDTDDDPHTPLKFKGKIKGFLWSHIGWMLVGEGSYKSIDKVTMVKLGRNKILKWQLRYYWQLAVFMNTIVPFALGYIIGGNLVSAYAGYLFIGIGRALQQQMTFCVNSACHFFGTKKYSDGTAGDIWWLAMFLLGENWHNFHHAFPSDYRNGARWYQTDVHKWIIYLMSKLGLAWDLKRTDQDRINAKIYQTTEQVISSRREKLQVLANKVNEIASRYQEKLSGIENISNEFTQSINKSFLKAYDSLENIKFQINQQLRDIEKSSEKIIKVFSKKLSSVESSMHKLFAEIEKTDKLA